MIFAAAIFDLLQKFPEMFDQRESEAIKQRGGSCNGSLQSALNDSKISTSSVEKWPLSVNNKKYPLGFTFSLVTRAIHVIISSSPMETTSFEIANISIPGGICCFAISIGFAPVKHSLQKNYRKA